LKLFIHTNVTLTTQMPGLYILDTEKRGRAVYCVEDISKGSLIEICPVIILDKTDTDVIHNTELHDFYFVWDIEKGTSAIALGYGSLYNHSDEPNAEFVISRDTAEIRILASQDIPSGTEIMIDYISAKDEGIELWFDPK